MARNLSSWFDDLDWVLAPLDGLASLWRSLLDTLRRQPAARAFAAVFLLGLLLRLLRPDWYAHRTFHPDERWLFDKTAELFYPAEPGRSDPAGLQYGSLPLYAVSALKGLIRLFPPHLSAYDASIQAGRLLSGLVDAATVAATFWLGAELLGLWAAVFAAALVAFAPLHIQLAHFFTVDPWLACFATLTLAACLRLARRPSPGLSAGVGVLYAAALASKSSGLPLLLPILLAHAWPALEPGLNVRLRAQRRREAARGLAWAAGATLLAFFAFMPWAFLNLPKFLRNQTEQRGILVTGSPSGTPYVRQYWDTTPLFHLKNLALYYLGLPAGLLALLALPLLGLLGARRALAAGRLSGQAAGAEWSRALGPLLLLAWALPYFAVVGNSFAKFARYMLPLLPTLAVGLALSLEQLQARSRRLALGAGLLCALAGLGWGLGYGLTYLRPHPWLQASTWTYQNVPATQADPAAPGGKRPTRTLNEDWGDDLPVGVEGQPSLSYAQLKGQAGQVNIVEWDSALKLTRLCLSLSQADVLFLADPRAYGTYLRLPHRFPLTHAYYDLLFQDPARLGFARAHEASNPVKLFGLLPLPDSRVPWIPRWLWADESFTLYDRPHAFVFRRIAPLSPEQVRAVLLARVHELGLSEEFLLGRSPDELQAHALGRPSRAAAPARAPSAAPAAAPAPPSAGAEVAVNPNYGLDRGGFLPLLNPVLAWWLLSLLLGWLALPLAGRVFRGFPAGGYALARALGVFLFAWLAYNLAWLGALPFTQAGLWALLGLLLAAALALASRRKAELLGWLKANRSEILFSEAVFAGAFLFFCLVRAFNPNIHDIAGQGYFGGGEPLGMTYLSAVTRCRTFPAYDPWLALANSSYYYFGYVLAAAMTKLSGFMPAVTYNLSLALFFSLTLLSAYGLLRALVPQRWVALGGAAMVGLAGSLWTVAYLVLQPLKGVSLFAPSFWHGFIWDPSRFPELVNGHIFEFPYFSYLYSDLHPHNMVLAFTILLAALYLKPFLSREAGWKAFGASPGQALLWLALAALLLDAQYAINTWSWPVMLALGAGCLAIGPWAGKGLDAGRGLKAAGWGLLFFAAALGLGRLLMSGFRLYYLQNGGNRIGTVLPNEWSMSAYIPLAYFLPGLAALALLAGHRLRQESAELGRRLKWERLRRQGLPDALLESFDRLLQKSPLGLSLGLLGACALGLLLLWALLHQAHGGVIWLALGLGLACLALFALGGHRRGAEAWLLVLGGFSCLLVAGAERWFVADRMNTIFKFWMNAWVLMGLVFGAGFAWAFAREEAPRGRRRSGGAAAARRLVWLGSLGAAGAIFLAARIDAALFFRGGRFSVSFLLFAALLLGCLGLAFARGGQALRAPLARGLFLGLLGLGLLYPLGATLARINEASGFRFGGLDGLAFMAQRQARGADARDYDRHDYVLIRWLNENASVTETVLEAPGIELYKGYNRFAIYTGLPTLLGWEYQEGQQLGERTGGQLEQRKRDAAAIYSGDEVQARALLKRYRVRWIAVGNLERRLYPAAGLDKLARLASPVAQDGPAVLYRCEWDKL